MKTKTKPVKKTKKADHIEKKLPKKSKKPVPGTDYEGKYTICPRCRMQGNKITNVLPKEDDIIIRYHACHRCGNSFKSVEEC